MLLSNAIRFQKTLALAASASNVFEAEAAELAARRLMEMLKIDPTVIPDPSLYNRMNFGDNDLLKKLRAEWREQHPVAVPPVKKQHVPDNDTFVQQDYTIPFNMTGFLKHTQKKKKRRPPGPRATLTRQDYEAIRTGYNQGLSSGQIGRHLGHKGSTINSSYRWHIVSGRWYRDTDDQLQWNGVASQPIVENTEQNESISSP